MANLPKPPRPYRPPPRAGGGWLFAAASVVETLRWAFLPLAMGALLAAGAHAAADVLDDQFLALADRLDALFDALVSRWSVTASLVDLVDVEERTLFARALALGFELWADLVLALPALGYDERHDEWARAKELLRRAWARPSVLRLVRAPVAAALSVAGACGVARLVHGQLFVAFRHLAGPGGAAAAARFGSLAALLLVLGSISWRAALRALEFADQRSEPRTARTALRGLAGTLVLLPLGAAALLRASPVLSFFR